MHQARKAQAVRGREEQYLATMARRSARVRQMFERLGPIPSDARVIEVGSGAHGLVFCFGSGRAVGVDPLAAEYATMFPHWQRRVPTVVGLGDALPFPSHSFDIVLCDNVIDHAEQPAGIVAELARVLAPAGRLYFMVHVHHPLYALAASLHAMWSAAKVPIEIGPFADHTVHLTLRRARQLFEGLPLDVESETIDTEEAKRQASQHAPRHVGDLLKRVFFKNAPFEVLARRPPE